MKTSFHSGIRMTQVAAALAATLMASTAAQAATEAGTLTVTATVEGTCAVGDAALGFSNVTPTLDPLTGQMSATNAQADTQLSWACTAGTQATISFADGAYPVSGTPALRRMADNGKYLPYYLYSDSGRTTRLTVTPTLTGTGTTSSLTIYGSVLAADRSAAQAGSYMDTVTITITY